jgi:hypothetical protein
VYCSKGARTGRRSTPQILYGVLKFTTPDSKGLAPHLPLKGTFFVSVTMNNLLESQVTDLAYLAESPIVLSNDMNEQRHSSSAGAESPADTGNGSGNKRKADETNGNGTTHTRAKRNRYISIAWYVPDSLGPLPTGTHVARSIARTCENFTNLPLSNECKRRKIKCNGENPCGRCGKLSLECQYSPNCCTNGFKESEEFRQMNEHLAILQEQVDNLYANLNALRGGDGMGFPQTSEQSMSMSQPSIAQPVSPMNRYRPHPKHPSFHGPTSSAFSLDVAKNTLHNMGYQGLGVDEGVVTHDPTPVASPRGIQPPPLVNINGEQCHDPIWTFSKEEMIRLCRVYEEEMGIMYPVVNIERLIIHGSNLYQYINSALRIGLARTSTPGKGITDEDSCILKLVLACATLVESSGQSEVAYRLFESVREQADRTLHSEVIEVKSLPFLVLVVSMSVPSASAVTNKLLGHVSFPLR